VRILVVEDEAGIRESLREDLVRVGFNVDLAADGEEGLFSGTEYPVDVAIIDLGLPKMSGLELIRHLREKGKLFPILILTARDRWQDKVEGLEAGADDYVSKPFHMQELLARVRAQVRRASGHARSDIECGPLRLDTKTARVTLNGQPIKLTSHEYRLLAYLMHHNERVVSRSELVEHLYEQDFDRDSNTIEVFIGRLRKKIPPDMIKTIRGLGYRLSVDET
jgi:two-component system OmpR family response regulator